MLVSEADTVISGRHAKSPGKCPAKGIIAAEAERCSELIDIASGLAKAGARFIQPDGFDVRRRGAMESGFEPSTELPIGEMRQAGQGVHRKIAVEVRPDMGGDFHCAVGGLKLKSQWFGVLLLAARTLHEDD